MPNKIILCCFFDAMGQQKINVNANGKNGSFIGVVGCFSVLGVDVGLFFF